MHYVKTHWVPTFHSEQELVCCEVESIIPPNPGAISALRADVDVGTSWVVAAGWRDQQEILKLNCERWKEFADMSRRPSVLTGRILC